MGLVVADLEKSQRFLVQGLSRKQTELLPRQRDLILQAAREADRQLGDPAPPLASSKRIPWLFPLTTAAVLTLATLTLLNLPSSEPGAAQQSKTNTETKPQTTPDGVIPMEVALMPAPGPPDRSTQSNNPRPTAAGDYTNAANARAKSMAENQDLFLRKVAERLAEAPVPSEKDLPPLIQRSAINPIDQPALALPVHSGRASLAWITRSIRGDKKRPPANAVRLEEILNQFALRPGGPASIAQGVTLSSETITCPWKPSSTLLLISFRGAADSAREVSATFKANSATIRNFRLLGFASVSGNTTTKLPSQLPAKTITSLVIEIDPATPGNDLGSIEWTVSGQSAPPVALVRKIDSEPSSDVVFAALICSFAHWLNPSSSSLIDSELLAALARECASDTLPADRVDFLTLIDQALSL